MSTIFIFHGIGGHPGENWFPWLKENLEAKGHRVIVPAFPQADMPDLDVWTEHFSQYRDQINGDTVFVGHSLGGAFALRFLEHTGTQIAAAFLVSSVSIPTGSAFDPHMTTFTEHPYDWEKIRRNSRHFSVIHTDNDPYVPLSHARDLATNLGAGLTVIADGGHLNQTAGFTAFPLLLSQILKTAESGV